MKKEYNIKDKVWIHLGEPKLVEGRVVEIIDLAHLKEGHNPDRELYIIELKTGIDNVYEVRDFDQISPDAKGPINLFRKLDLKQVRENSRYLKKVGMALPVTQPNMLEEIAKELNNDLEVDPDEGDPTPEQIHAAIDSATAVQHTHISDIIKPTKPKRKFNNARKRKTAPKAA
jgi:hypothetical protein